MNYESDYNTAATAEIESREERLTRLSGLMHSLMPPSLRASTEARIGKGCLIKQSKEIAQDPATLFNLTGPLDSKRSSSQLTTPMDQYFVQHLPPPEPYMVDVNPKPKREIVHKHMCKRVQTKRCESRQESGQPYLRRDLCYKRRPQS